MNPTYFTDWEFEGRGDRKQAVGTNLEEHQDIDGFKFFFLVACFLGPRGSKLKAYPRNALTLPNQTVARWDTETGQRVGKNLALEGLIQCVEMASEGGGDGSPGDPVLVGGSSGVSGGGGSLGTGRVAYVGSTSKRIYTVDTRSPMAVVAEWSCDTFVNSLHVYSDGSKASADFTCEPRVVTWF